MPLSTYKEIEYKQWLHKMWAAESRRARFRPSAALSQHCGDTEDYMELREAELRCRGGQALVDEWLGSFRTVEV